MKSELVDLAERAFRVGPWLVEPALNRISRGDAQVQLELRLMDVLVSLAARAGEVVPRSEIVDAVWETEIISDNTLTHAITEIRNALGDDVRNPTYIETIHRRGYRLIAPVTVVDHGGSVVARFPPREKGARLEDEPNPYPGLAAFTEEGAPFFFGREGEVAHLWRKLTSRRLLAVIGPSGVGKSSFLRAGVLPARPTDWGVVVCEPGDAPFAALARSLVPEFADDRAAISKLVDLREHGEAVAMVSRWRDRYAQALLIVDQFEELFILNPAHIQTKFAELLRRLVDEADVRVLLGMRDDFLYRCHDTGNLAPLFDSLTAITPPVGDALRRAIVEPARRLGYTFEDENCVEAMVASVEGERGALPLLAFAVARLWDLRDTDLRLLTRQAYEEIGGVGGALARHAEATLKSLGDDRIPIARELFRNLVTAQGTRLVRSADDLLSIFYNHEPVRTSNPKKELIPAREAAADVLARLCDARLLTCFEEEGSDGQSQGRVEVVHESLLSSWPRLIAWRTQDADDARFRDEFRQAAHRWNNRGRLAEQLWTRSAYNEYRLWRKRFTGGLCTIEEEFGRAMTSFAKRRKRRRRLTAAAFSLTAAVLAVVFGLLWRQTVFHKRHAEAHQLIALGSNHLKTSSTAALAHATKSMELMDSIEARILALKALWEGPTAFIVNEDPTQHSSFSRGGKWLVQNHRFSKTMTIVSSDGLQRQVSHPQESGGIRLGAFFGGPEDVFFSWGNDRGNAELWSAASARPLASAGPLDNPGVAFSRGALGGDSDNPRAIWTMVEGGLITVLALTPDGGQERLGAIQLENSYGHIESVCAPRVSANWLAVVDGHEISIVMVEDNGLSKRTRLGRHEGELLSGCEADPFGRFFVTANRSDDLKLWGLSGHLTSNDIDGPHRLLWYDIAQYGSTVVAVTESRDSKEKQAWIWSIDGDRFRAIRQFPLASFRGSPAIDPNGHWLAHPGPISASSLWSCGSPAGSEPILLRIGQTSHSYSLQFSPDGRWIAVSDLTGLSLWPLSRPFPAVMRLDYEEGVGSVAFGPEGEFVVISAGGVVSLIPLDGSGAAVGRTAMKAGRGSLDVEVSPDGEVIASCNTLGEIWIWRDGGEEPTLLPGPKEPGGGLIAFSPEANFVAALCGSYPRDETEYRVWSVPDAREVAVLRLDGDEFRGGSLFTDDGRLITGTSRGVVAWNVEEGDGEVLVEANVFNMAASGDGQRLLMTEEAEEGFLEGPVGYPVFLDLETGGSTTLITHGSRVRSLAVDRDGTLAVTGDPDGVIRVGPVTGEEPHLLLGHEGHVGSLTIDPLGRWIASAGQDNTIRLWPMPDLSKPPLHTLPRDELIAKLKTLTNLQVVRDEQSPSGWKIEVGPFPGWETVPTW